MKRVCVLCLSFLALLACGAAVNFSIDLIFPDADSREQTARLQIQAIEPGADASCEALLGGEAQAGDEGYVVEREIEIDMATGASGPLEQVGPGLRLFYARAFDSDERLILHGCASVLAGGGGPESLSIELQESCQPSNGGVEVCDGRDNDCNGQIDDGDAGALCPAVPMAAASACVEGVCEYSCDEGWVDANESWSDGCECRITRQGVELCDGLDNDCDGQVDEDCIACALDEDCADEANCLEGVCSEGQCQLSVVADGTACDDQNICTQSTTCQDGFCLGQALDCDDSNPCTDDGCDPATGCVYDFNRAECDDGDRCTEEDACDGAGSCRGREVTCNEPPAAFCIDGSQLQRYAAYGLCAPESGCEYAAEVVECALGCVEGGCRSSQCQGQAEATPCDDNSACTVNDACDANEVCRGEVIDCSDGNVCTTDGCDPEQGCSNEFNTSACDDGDPCTVQDVCSRGVCLGQAKDCDDGLSCTDDSCSSTGACVNALRAGFCAIGGQCLSTGSVHQTDPCLRCNPALDPYAWTVAEGAPCSDGLFCNGIEFCDERGYCISPGSPCGEQCNTGCSEASGCIPDPFGTECDDGIDCTLGDACDGLGACLSGAPDDELCGPGSICLPDCDGDGDGCTTLPVLSVDCPDEVPYSSSASCVISLQQAETGADCLSCQVFVEPKRLSYADFSAEGQPGFCEEDGWFPVDAACEYRPIGSLYCIMHNDGEPCCQNYACPASEGAFAGEVAIEFSRLSCGPTSGAPQLRLEQAFALQSYNRATLCWDVALDNRNDMVFQVAFDSMFAGVGNVFFCMEEYGLPDRSWQRMCEDLPSMAFQAPETWLAFWMGTRENSNAVWYLDNISLDAGWSVCPPSAHVMFSETFAGCSGVMSAPWNGWSFTGDPVCSHQACGPSMLGDRFKQFSLERVVDTRGQERVLELCYMRYAHGMAVGKISLELDTGDGQGWQLAHELPLSEPVDPCREICVDLSSFPGASENPELGLRFQVEALGETIAISAIELRSLSRCDAESLGWASLSEMQDLGEGQYGLDVADTRGTPLDVVLQCRWGERDDVRVEDVVSFIQ